MWQSATHKTGLDRANSGRNLCRAGEPKPAPHTPPRLAGRTAAITRLCVVVVAVLVKAQPIELWARIGRIRRKKRFCEEKRAHNLCTKQNKNQTYGTLSTTWHRIHQTAFRCRHTRVLVADSQAISTNWHTRGQQNLSASGFRVFILGCREGFVRLGQRATPASDM